MNFNGDADFFKKEPRLARGTSVYLENSEKKFLLQLRTKDVSREPDKWTAISGYLEPFENPQDTIIREAQEELGVPIKNLRFFRDYVWVSSEGNSAWYNHNFVFHATIDVPADKIHLTEGQKVDYFSIPEILKMNLAFNHNTAFRDILVWLGYQSK